MADCFIYCRVSTSSQDLTSQEELCRAFAKENKINIVDIYKEKITGEDFKRPELTEMIANLTKYKIGIILVSDMDRFSRAKPSAAMDVLDNIVDLGVSVHSIIDGQVVAPDSTLEQQFSSGIRLYVAWYERRKIKQRTKRGYDAYRTRQLAGLLDPETELPIGGQKYELEDHRIDHIKALRKAQHSKAWIYRTYIRGITLFKHNKKNKMTLKTFYKVCKRCGIR